MEIEGYLQNIVTSVLKAFKVQYILVNNHVHCKKRLAGFPFPAELTKLSLCGNYLIIPAQGEFGK